MSNEAPVIVQKLWGFCNVLRDDGVSYGDYVQQLTNLLFLKMADELTKPPHKKKSIVPKGYGWETLLNKSGEELRDHYNSILKKLGTEKKLLGLIYRGSENKIRAPAKLSKLIKLIDRYSRKLSKNHEYFIKSSYLSIYEEIKLNFLLNKFPIFNHNTVSIDSHFDEKIRSKFLINLNDEFLHDEFIKITFFMIRRHIPTVFIEGYHLLNEILDSQRFPKNPKKIFTSNSFEYDEIFKIYSAKKTENGTKLIIGQHGGFYGVSKWNHGEDHIIDIADNFISWGWNSQNKKVLKGFNFTPLLPYNKSRGNSSKAIFLTHPVARFNWKSQSWPASASQSNSYMDDHLKFFYCLDEDIRKSFVYRILISSDLENKTSFIEKVNNNFGDIDIDEGKIPLKKVINKYKLACIAYNATNILHTLSSNFPTVIFWNEKNFELRNEAIPFFKKLKEANIFHSSPVSAANHVNYIWNNVDKWWQNKKTQKAKDDFCLNFSKIEEENVLNLKKIKKNI